MLKIYIKLLGKNIIKEKNMKELRVDFISDLHLDFWMENLNPQSPKFQKQLQEFVEMIQPKPGKVLILSGDQGHYFSQDSALLLELKKYYQNILIVPGNHDRYLVSHNQQKKYRWDSFKRLLEMKRFCDKTNGLYFMDGIEGNVIVIDGFKIGGLGMWHDWSYGKELGYSEIELEEIWKQAMNDANLIFKDSKKNYTISFGYNGEEKIVHFKPIELYKEYREKLDKMEPVDLMFSHYGPIIPDDISEDYKEDEVTSFYYFDGASDIFRLKPQYWIHGHTHTKYESNRSGTKVITNPLGYPSENSYTTIQSIYLK